MAAGRACGTSPVGPAAGSFCRRPPLKWLTRCRYTVEVVADRAGDFGSFEELAMPLFAKLYNFAHWLTQDRAAAEDLVQETYMKALRGFSSFQPGTNFRAWIYRILRNTFLTSKTGLKAAQFDPDGEE